MENEQLTHWGIRGMKWGVRRYQTKDGKLTPEGRKRYNEDIAKLKEKNAKLDAKLKTKAAQDRAKARVDKLLAENAAKKKALKGETDETETKNTSKATKKAVKEAKPKTDDDVLNKDDPDFAKKKESILRSQDPKKILKNAHLFTTQELNEAVTRMTYEKNLRGLIPEEVSKGRKFVENAVDMTGKMSTIANNVTNTYDKAATIYNLIPESAKKKWGFPTTELPKISGGKEAAEKKAKADREAEIRKMTLDKALKELSSGNLTQNEIEYLNKKFQAEKKSFGTVN